jgi:hypothetical protein
MSEVSASGQPCCLVVFYASMLARAGWLAETRRMTRTVGVCREISTAGQSTMPEHNWIKA